MRVLLLRSSLCVRKTARRGIPGVRELLGGDVGGLGGVLLRVGEFALGLLLGLADVVAGVGRLCLGTDTSVSELLVAGCLIDSRLVL
jgi:hypothetical protein